MNSNHTLMGIFLHHSTSPPTPFRRIWLIFRSFILLLQWCTQHFSEIYGTWYFQPIVPIQIRIGIRFIEHVPKIDRSPRQPLLSGLRPGKKMQQSLSRFSCSFSNTYVTSTGDIYPPPGCNSNCVQCSSVLVQTRSGDALNCKSVLLKSYYRTRYSTSVRCTFY